MSPIADVDRQRVKAGAFGVCACGHPIYDHARRSIPSGGGLREYTACRVDGCGCTHWQASDGSRWPDGPAGAAA